MVSVREQVEMLLEEDEKCRNVDLYLILKFWNRFHGFPVDLSIFDGVPNEEAEKLLTNAETIRRARQKINEEGRFEATDPDILEKRRLKQS
ncbi:MAG: hypothetical protein ACFFCS_23135 [Candidatus Hodarchaeota archaeon]